MSTDYTAMWRDLGLDLAAHDQLLAVLGQGYQDIFLSQSDRPKGMDYFNFVMSEVHGLRIRELLDAKTQGRKVIGSFCVFVPEEVGRAVGAEMVGLCTGADFALEEVEKYLPTSTCALIKSAFGFKLGKVCPFLESADLIVGENTCDGKKKAYETFDQLVPNLYVMDLPQVKSAQGKALLAAEMARFKDKVEELSGRAIDAEMLREGIRVVNAKRAALARLNALRAADPAPISGLDGLLVNQVAFYDDPKRFTASVHQLCDELEERVAAGRGAMPKGAPRLLLSGCPMAVPNWKVPWVVESAGAVIVGEESCVGARGSRNLVDDTGLTVDELMAAIVDRYFDIDCAIFTPNPERAAHAAQMGGELKADGVVHYAMQFCQPYQMEAAGVKKTLEAGGLPTLKIETDYGMGDVGQLKTRVEAFLETL